MKNSTTVRALENRASKENFLFESLKGKTEYDPLYGIALIKHCQEGYSLESFGGRYAISPSTLENWKNQAEFMEAWELARAALMFCWEEIFMNADNKDELLKAKFMLETLGYKNKSSKNPKDAVATKTLAHMEGSMFESSRNTSKEALEALLKLHPQGEVETVEAELFKDDEDFLL